MLNPLSYRRTLRPTDRIRTCDRQIPCSSFGIRSTLVVIVVVVKERARRQVVTKRFTCSTRLSYGPQSTRKSPRRPASSSFENVRTAPGEVQGSPVAPVGFEPTTSGFQSKTKRRGPAEKVPRSIRGLVARRSIDIPAFGNEVECPDLSGHGVVETSHWAESCTALILAAEAGSRRNVRENWFHSCSWFEPSGAERNLLSFGPSDLRRVRICGHSNCSKRSLPLSKERSRSRRKVRVLDDGGGLARS